MLDLLNYAFSLLWEYSGRKSERDIAFVVLILSYSKADQDGELEHVGSAHNI